MMDSNRMPDRRPIDSPAGARPCRRTGRATRASIAAVLIALVGGPAPAQHGDHAAPGHEVDVLADIHVAFELEGADGALVTAADFAGRPLLLTFGFTRCPHICPTMAAAMGAALGLSARDASGVFISVDTERDTPAVTDAYARNFGERMIGLSGSYEQVAEAANNFGVSFAVTKSQAAYTVQHTANIYVIGSDGMLREVLPLNASPATLAAALDE